MTKITIRKKTDAQVISETRWESEGGALPSPEEVLVTIPDNEEGEDSADSPVI